MVTVSLIWSATALWSPIGCPPSLLETVPAGVCSSPSGSTLCPLMLDRLEMLDTLDVREAIETYNELRHKQMKGPFQQKRYFIGGTMRLRRQVFVHKGPGSQETEGVRFFYLLDLRES